MTAPLSFAEIARARVVLTCGVSGSGKTYLARRLEAEGFRRVSSDRLIWQRFGDGFPSLQAEERKAAFADVGRQADAELKRLLEAGERVVVDATFCKRTRRDAVRALCREMGVEPLIVYLDVPRRELLRRLALRKGAGPDDQIVAASELDSYLENFQRPAADEPFALL